MAPQVHIIKTDWRLAQGKDWVKRINELAYNQEYLEFIASLQQLIFIKDIKF